MAFTIAHSYDCKHFGHPHVRVLATSTYHVALGCQHIFWADGDVYLRSRRGGTHKRQQALGLPNAGRRFVERAPQRRPVSCYSTVVVMRT
jgi:hypothetical protein